jgi:hypothetical protein
MTYYKSTNILSETGVKLNKDYCFKTQKKFNGRSSNSQIVKYFMYAFVLGWNVYLWLKLNLVPCEP